MPSTEARGEPGDGEATEQTASIAITAGKHEPTAEKLTAWLLPRGARIAVRAIVVFLLIVVLLGVHASVFGGPLKPFFCELAGREISRNGEYCIGKGLGW
jgi:hypothetical protein